jgi:NitT/TauT family transport system permease protein
VIRGLADRLKSLPVPAQRSLFFAGLLGLWLLLGVLEVWPSYIFPTLQGVVASLSRGISRGTLPLAVWGSIRRLAVGYSIALTSGIATGFLMAHLRWFKNTFGLLVLGLQTLPSICWLPLAILWFGLSEKAILFVVVMGAFLSIALAAEDGIRNTPPVFIQAARNLGAGGARLYRAVILPSAMPTLVTGMKLGWSFAWRSLMAGELIYAVPGLGYLLMMGRELNDMNQVVAVILVIMLLGLVTDKLVFSVLERRVRSRWGTLPGR